MDLDAARRILDVGPDASADDVRRSYLGLIRRHHPDVAATPATIDAADLTEAFRVVHAALAGGVVADERRRPTIAVDVDGDTLSIELPPDETFLVLLDVLSTVGAVTYVDPEAGLIETMLELSSGTRCSLVASLQGRAAHGSTDAFLTLDDPHAADVGALAGELAELVAGSLSS